MGGEALSRPSAITPDEFDKYLWNALDLLMKDEPCDEEVDRLINYWRELDGGILFGWYFGAGEQGPDVFKRAMREAARIECDEELCTEMRAQHIDTQVLLLGKMFRNAHGQVYKTS